MKQYFVVADVHGFYNELNQALYKKGFRHNNKEHILILCGDAFDRGNQAVKMFKFLSKIQKQNRLIYIKGNHEDLLFDCVDELDKYCGCCYTHHYSNGTVGSVIQFEEQNILKDVLNFIEKNSIDYYETKNYIFVHGWIHYNEPKENKVNEFDLNLPTYNKDWRNADKANWEKTRWLNGMEANVSWNIYEPNKTIVCGHWHCSWGNHLLNPKIEEFPKDKKQIEKSFRPYKNKGIIAIDTCTAYTHKVNVLVINEDEI